MQYKMMSKVVHSSQASSPLLTAKFVVALGVVMTRSTYLVVALLASVLLVVSFCDAQENPDLLLPSQGVGEEVGKKKPWPCCDMCICTRSNPPQCRCQDVLVGGCHRNCKSCVCTKSMPPYCRCTDVIFEHCGKRCHPEE